MEAISWCGLTQQAVEHERNAQRRQNFANLTDTDIDYVANQYVMAAQFWNQANVPEYVHRCIMLRNMFQKEQEQDKKHADPVAPSAPAAPAPAASAPSFVSRIGLTSASAPLSPNRQSRIMEYFQSQTYKQRRLAREQQERERQRDKWMRRARAKVYEEEDVTEITEAADDATLMDWM